MEEDLKILKVELFRHWSDLSQIFNLSWGDQIYTHLQRRMKKLQNSKLGVP